MRDQKKIAKISQLDNHFPLDNNYLPFDDLPTPHSHSVHLLPADTSQEEKSVPLTAYLPPAARKLDRLSFI